MSFLKTTVATLLLSSVLVSNAHADHRYKRAADHKYVGNICFGFSSPVDQNWHNALKSAVSRYNNAFKNTTKLGFCYNSSYNSSPHNATFYITLNVKNFGYKQNWNAISGFPGWDKQPHHEINVNTYYMDSVSQSDKVTTIMHEMGHTIGIMHTDEGRGNVIPNMYGYDNMSLFRDFTGDTNSKIPDFTKKDIKAIEFLY